MTYTRRLIALQFGIIDIWSHYARTQAAAQALAIKETQQRIREVWT